MREDHFTNTIEDAAEFERMRADGEPSIAEVVEDFETFEVARKYSALPVAAEDFDCGDDNHDQPF